MSKRYILAIDQSTSGTKLLLFDELGSLAARFDKPHRQIVDANGWVEHDPNEIWNNVLALSKQALSSGVLRGRIIGVAVSNQRETALAWDRATGEPLYNAIVWQCGRGEAVCRRISGEGKAELVKRSTGLSLSPYFSAAKFAWILENVPAARMAQGAGRLCCSTMDSWLVYKLTGGKSVLTDYSNASRTQLFNIHTLDWDENVASLFGVKIDSLPALRDSNGYFGHTDLGGLLREAVPINAVMGDSHGALYGQGCLTPGAVKATYGTGSSVMMNIGSEPIQSPDLVTSLAWRMNGRASYVLEGNLNYTGAVIKWLVEDLGLISSAEEAGRLAAEARRMDGLYLVPAFSGLGAPYWDAGARAILCGMDRGCGKKEIVRAAEECIAYQITDILRLMRRDAMVDLKVLRADGGPSREPFLMQFQSDIAGVEVRVSAVEELSGMGVAYAVGIALGLYDRQGLLSQSPLAEYRPTMEPARREALYAGWRNAVKKAMSQGMNLTNG